MKLAAIDIGSNAVRLLLANVYFNNEEAVFKKAELVRMPLRLGEDAFRFGRIAASKEEQLIQIMSGFRHLIAAFEAVEYRACATAAMREAANNKEIIQRIKKVAGLDVEIIDGRTEAQIIYSNHIAEHLEHDCSYLYIDVGGGSTELTLFSANHIVASQSFNIGTIRMLQETISRETWVDFKNWIKAKCESHQPLKGIGSGGNINKIYKMVARKDKGISFARLKNIYDELQSMTYDERINVLGLNPDRADVIVPAAKIFLTVMKSAEISEILVPQIGLSDGIIHQLYEKQSSMPGFSFPG